MKRRRSVSVSVLLLSIAPCGILWAQAAPCPAGSATALEQRLQARLDRFVATNPAVPSALLHVESPRRCLSWSGASGVLAADSDAPVRPEHTFRIASNTKTYTAAAVLRLMEQGRLQLSDTLDSRLSPEFVQLLESGGYPAGRMTLLQLLTHTSGLFDHGATRGYFDAIMADPQRRWQRVDQLRFSVTQGRPYGPPGEVFHYSDTGYVLLGGIIAGLTGENLGRAFRKLLDFDRLGLAETWMESMEPRPDSAGERVHQYFGAMDTFDWDPSMDLYGGGGLVTSARDLAAFPRALFEGRVFAEPSTFEAMHATQPVPNRMNYRIGIYGLEVDGHPGWGHTGFWNTFAFHFPELDITVAGSVNQQQGPSGSRLAAEVVRAILAL